LIRGLISIGTNSTRALVAQFGDGAPATLLHRSTGTRIGEGLRRRGHLEEAAMQRTLDAIAEHAAAIREHTGDFEIIATSALRRADNEADFDARVRALTGTGVQIISGEEEAASSFAGALSGVNASAQERFGVLDVGGGSSEYAIGTKRECETLVSCEIGAVRLTEAFAQLAGTSGAVSADVLERARSQAAQALQPALQLPRVERLVLVGGSATTTVSLVRGKREFFTYEQLDVRAIETWIARLAATPLEQRKTLAGMNPQRADILLGGLLLIAIVAQASGVNVALVSTSDVLLGYLLRHPAER
jgi:exopolyphosphatase/guanosine-5'-triphosphate,3'-diphosphate pyrophosphatase